MLSPLCSRTIFVILLEIRRSSIMNNQQWKKIKINLKEYFQKDNMMIISLSKFIELKQNEREKKKK